MVAANYTSQDLSPSPSSLLEFKEYQEYKEYQESRGYTQPHLGISSLKEQQGEESRKKVIDEYCWTLDYSSIVPITVFAN